MIDKRTFPGQEDDTQAVYSIGKVSEITGINAITLRAWERRYNIVTPQRTDSGHRLYSTDDVEKINTAKRLIATGIKISQVKNLIGSNDAPLLDVIPMEHRNKQSQWHQHINAVRELISELDMSGLEEFHLQLFANYAPAEIGSMLCGPILATLKEDASGVAYTSGHYHAYHSFISQFICSHLLEFNSTNDEARILVIDQNNEMNRLLMLWYLLLLRAEGYNPLLLDRKPPLEAIPSISLKYNPGAIIIYDCEHVPFELIAQLDIPIFITSVDQTDININGDKIKSLPYELVDNIAELKKHISSSTS